MRMKKLWSISLFGKRHARSGGVVLVCLLLSGVCIASAAKRHGEDTQPTASPPLLLASAATETGHETATESHASAAPTLPRRSEGGPRTYPISEVFLSSGIPEPTPTPKPTPPPEAFHKPILEPYRPPELLGTPFFDTSSSTHTVIPFRLPSPTPRPTPTPQTTPRPVRTAQPTPLIRKPTPSPRAIRPEAAAPTQSDPLDLNAASIGELARVPGLGPHRARLIVAHRRTIGGFERLDQLLDVFGISEERFTEAAPVLTLAPYTAEEGRARRPFVPRTGGALPEPENSAGTAKPSPSGVFALP
jgi:hypothetical protein